MTGLEQLRELADGVAEWHRLFHVTTGGYDEEHGISSANTGLKLKFVLLDIADQIESEQDALVKDSPYDALPPDDREAIAWVRERGGIEELRRMFQDADNRRVELCGALGIDLDKGWSEAMAAMRLRLMPEGMEWPRTDTGELVKLSDPLIDDDALEKWREVDTIIFQRAEDGYTVEIENDRGVSQLYRPGERVKHPERKGSRLDGCCPCGSYKCDEFAFYDQDRGKDVFADKCLVPELRKLRESGIRTIASCCGHGTMRPNIVVAPECEDEMRRQGYEGRRNKFGVLEFTAKSECPAPKVLDADGVEIRVGDTIWDVEDGTKYEVCKVVGHAVTMTNGGYYSCGFPRYCPSNLTHRAPVLAADGKPLREGETVWDTKGNGPYVIRKIEPDGVIRIDGNDLDYFGADFVHERPDSWERLEEDASKNPFDYCKGVGHRLDTCENSEAYKARDLVRRAKALAGGA